MPISKISRTMFAMLKEPSPKNATYDGLEPKFGYRPARELAPNIWEVTGEWRGPFGRRMTIVRLKSGALFIHNAMHLRRADLEWLKSLGAITYIVAPNKYHASEAGWMMKHAPTAQLFVPKEKITEFVEKGFEPLDVAVSFPDEIAGELLCLPSMGTRFAETVFLHRPSRTLILCDLAFNMKKEAFSGFEATVMRWNKVGGRFGPTMLLKWLLTSDRKKLVAFYRQLLELDFERVIVNHGDIVEADGRAGLKKGIEEIFGKL